MKYLAIFLTIAAFAIAQRVALVLAAENEELSQKIHADHPDNLRLITDRVDVDRTDDDERPGRRVGQEQ